ncbi:MAG TPA: VanW family protein [Methylomirabilota bacterium]|nr:VanW family protein [Methylomirabilota bacterium]
MASTEEVNGRLRRGFGVRSTPSRRQAALFLAKAWCFRLQRWLRDPAGSRPQRLGRQPVVTDAPLLALSRSPLYTSEVAAEFILQAGKVENLRIAARRLNGIVIPAGGLFSFWRQLSRPTRWRGFVRGRELREGCVIASIGGGLCQLSNALYDAALTAGCEIVERHAHSRRLPGSMAARGRDATIFWNYVDLRFRAMVDCQLAVALTRDELTVTIRRIGEGGGQSRRREAAEPSRIAAAAIAESCESCGMTGCFRHGDAAHADAITAWLVDAWWPEHAAYVREQAQPDDWLFTPLDSGRLGIGPYRWPSERFTVVRHAPWLVAQRSRRSRRLTAQGAARQEALLAMDAALARHYSRRLPVSASHLVVSQTLLPFLWRDGALGGRRFDVLMTRLPMAELHATLDRAARTWPQSRTLSDFRADPDLLAAESTALAAADRWITPHSRIAALAGARAERLSWDIPLASGAQGTQRNRLVFPATTLGRKGAYELREAAQELGLLLTLGGPTLEADDFWDGMTTVHGSDAWLRDTAAVVLPAWIEDQPRRLLQAIAAGIPVIASEACGLDGMAGVRVVPTGDTHALREALHSVVPRSCDRI